MGISSSQVAHLHLESHTGDNDGYSTGCIPPTEDLEFASDKIQRVKSVPYDRASPPELSVHNAEGFVILLRQLKNPLRDLRLFVLHNSFGLIWEHLCLALRDHSGDTLQTLQFLNCSAKIWQGSDPNIDLTLLGPLPHPRHLTIDFPGLEPAFEDADIVDIVTTFPGLTELSLSPVARFPRQDTTRRRFIWNYARRDSREGSVR
ncbi:hypothetical protein BKA93DRAFT_44319 [Sparassis latifolia]